MKYLKEFLFLLLLILIPFSLHFFMELEKLNILTTEDGLFEWMGAISFLLASISFFILFVKTKRLRKKVSIKWNKIFFLLLGILFLVGFCEEISWGQRILNYDTPEGIKKLNVQQEINIHNLAPFARTDYEFNEKQGFWDLILNADRIFSLFWFSYCFLLPLLFLTSKWAKRILMKMKLPLPPLYFGVLFIINYTLSRTIDLVADASILSRIELKEFNFALLFLFMGIWFLRELKNMSADNKLAA